MRKKGERKRGSSIPKWLWTVISVLLFLVVWYLVAASPGGSIVMAKPLTVLETLGEKLGDGTLWPHVAISLYRVIVGFAIGFCCAIPLAFLMGWYEPVRNLLAPWVQFVRNIPPLAYIPLVILGAGVGEKSKIIVIFLASFLVSVVTIYQGVCNVDTTLIKAARVLGAKNKDIFRTVVIPASTPFILVAARLGLSSSLTTLIAAELTGASRGLGMMIQKAQSYYDRETMLLGIVIIGVIGIIFERIVYFLERRLTGWQETQGQQR